MRRVRVAIVADLLEERWPSMDLVADMLVSQISSHSAELGFDVELLRPTLATRGRKIGRYVSRFWDYSRWLREKSAMFDVFHVVDHSYAHLVHVLPPARTVVTCHDVDAFMPLFDPRVIPTRLPTLMTRVILSGMRKAACVTCDSAATRDEALKFSIVSHDRLVVVPVGVHPSLTREPTAEAYRGLDRMLGSARDSSVPELLHVGTCIPRKRIDLLLRILAAFREVEPRARLLKAGGSLTTEQQELARRLGVDAHIVQLPFLETPALAALYRRATVALVTSEREGFGLPVVEALAAGTPVVVTDIPVLREVGGAVAGYAPLGDIPRWRDALLESMRGDGTQRDARLEQARRFTWTSFADSMATIYHRLSGREVHAGA